MKIDNALVERGKQLKMGIRSTAESEDLIVWLELKSTGEIRIDLERK